MVADVLAWERHLGPLRTGRQFAGLVGLPSPEAATSQVEANRLIGLRGPTGTVMYPVFQAAEGAVDRHLVDAFWIVARQSDDWTAASWCVSPDPALGGVTPVDFLAAGGNADRVLTVARQDAARLSQ